MLAIGNQLKAARSLAGIDQRRLAELAALNVSTIRSMEASADEPIAGRSENVQAVQRVLESAGIDFLGHGRPGVRLQHVGDHPKPVGPATDVVEAMVGGVRALLGLIRPPSKLIAAGRPVIGSPGGQPPTRKHYLDPRLDRCGALARARLEKRAISSAVGRSSIGVASGRMISTTDFGSSSGSRSATMCEACRNAATSFDASKVMATSPRGPSMLTT